MARAAFFTAETLKFLKQLRQHNDREWFNANKERYEEHVKAPALRFIGDLGPHLSKVSKHYFADPRPQGGSMMRIYRDTRFSKDKSPYKINIGAHFGHKSSTKDVHAPGFYLHIEPGNSFVGAGLWMPEPPSLKAVRDAIVAHPKSWSGVVRAGIEIDGEQLKRPPAGYPPEHPYVEDLKRKSFTTGIKLSDKDVTSPAFLDTFVAGCKQVAPLMRFLNEALGLPF